MGQMQTGDKKKRNTQTTLTAAGNGSMTRSFDFIYLSILWAPNLQEETTRMVQMSRRFGDSFPTESIFRFVLPNENYVSSQSD